MKRYYDFIEASEELGMSYTHISRKCTKLKIKCKIGRYGKKFLSEKQLDDLRPTYFMIAPEPTGNVIEVIRITETFYIYESKLNAM